jgi:hypothetical protein
MKNLCGLIAALLVLSLAASAQSRFSNAGISAGYTHISGYQGLNGFDVGGEVIVVSPVSIAFDYDGAWSNSTVTTFQLKNHLQDIIIGPRIYFPGKFSSKNKKQSGTDIPCTSTKLPPIMPFLEVQFGESHLNSTNTVVNVSSISSSDTAFTWEAGGGGDIRLNPHWALRTKLDFLRTHFYDTGQSHARFVFGLEYSVKPRRKW